MRNRNEEEVKFWNGISVGSKPAVGMPLGSGSLLPFSGTLAVTPTLGAELLENNTFTAWTADDPDNWTVQNEDVNNYVTEDAGVGARMVSDNSAVITLAQGIGVSDGDWLEFYFTQIVNVTRGCRLAIINTTATTENVANTGTTTRRVRATGAVQTLQLLRNTVGAMDATVTVTSAKQITNFRRLRNFGQADVIVKVAAIIGADGMKGVSVNWDAAGTSGVDCYVDRRKALVYLVKYVSGTPTQVFSNAVTYVEEAHVEVRKSGETYQVFYNDVQVGTDQTISDAEIINNTYHGVCDAEGTSGSDAFFCSVNS